MSGFHSHARGRLPAQAVGRRRRLIRLLGAAVLVAFVGLLIWGRFFLAADRQTANLERGAASLTAALTGDERAWDAVDAAYGDAARASVLDGYPLFVLELTQHLRTGEAVGDTPEVRATVEALLASDFEAASARAALIADTRGREWMQRLAAELLVVSREHPPKKSRNDPG